MLIAHAVVGGRRWRAHDGYLFSYANGGWRKLTETTPPAVLREVSVALVTLEGFYLCCGKHAGLETSRNSDLLLARLKIFAAQMAPVDFADKTVLEEGHFLRNHKGPGRVASDGGPCDWAERQADCIANLRKKLMGELSTDAFRRSYVEWTGTPYEPEGLGIAFGDCFVGPQAESAQKGPEKNAYVQLSYAILLPDPVLDAVGGRLKKFLGSRFYENAGGLRLYLSLEAMAAHHENANVTLFFQDRGGKGKSALSALRANVWGQMHAFADPSIFFTDEELRKQGVDLRHKLFVTIQETRERRKAVFLEHLWGKFSTQEKVAIRPNYAKRTRMVSFSGLKVWELNRAMVGLGCTWEAIRRRVLCIHLRANFTSDPGLVDESNGVFLRDRGLVKFLASSPCAAAYMRKVFLPFLRCTSLAVCGEHVEDPSIIDRSLGSSIVDDSDELTREITGARDEQGGEAARCHQLALPFPIEREADLVVEGATVRDSVLRSGERLVASRLGHSRLIPGTVRTPKGCGKGAKSKMSRKAKMQEYVTLGLFRLGRDSEYVPVIPTTEFLPMAKCGKLTGYVELPDVDAVRGIAEDEVLMANLRILRDAWRQLRARCPAGSVLISDKDAAAHIAALEEAASLPLIWLRQLERKGGRLDMVYDYKTPFGGRRYAQDKFASQNVSRFLREIAFGGSTVEVDMRNAFPAILSQLVVKTCGAEYAAKMSPWLLEYASNRDTHLPSIAAWMGATTKQAKDLVLRLLHGGSLAGYFRGGKRAQDGNAPLLAPPQKAVPPALEGIQREGRFCMRLAEQLMPEVSRHFAPRDRPERTTLHYFVALVEDRIVAEAEKFLASRKVEVNSIHFDGILARSSQPQDIQSLLGDMSEHVADELDYRVEFALKEWPGGFFGYLKRNSQPLPHLSSSHPPGGANCIIAASLAIINPNEYHEAHREVQRSFAEELSTGASLPYAAVDRHLSRCFGFCIRPVLAADGLDALRNGAGVLLHQGQHCVGLVLQDDGFLVRVVDTADTDARAVPYDDVLGAILYAPGKQSAQLFLCAHRDANAPVADKWQETVLQLRARGGEDSEPDPSAEMLASLTKERNVFLQELRRSKKEAAQQTAYTCRLCPSRAFGKKIYLVTHLENFHGGGAVAASSKQLRVCQSLYNADRLAAAVDAVFHLGEADVGGRGLLERSAAMLRGWVEGSPNFDLIRGRATSWDDFVALVLTEGGPKYLLKADLGSGFTRCGNVYFTEAFGDLLLAIALSPDTKGCQRRVRGALVDHFDAAGSLASFLTPHAGRVIRDLQKLVVSGPLARRVVSRCFEFLTDTGEFEILSHDGTYKVAMGIIGQPHHGLKTRRRPVGSAAPSSQRGDEVHVVQTLRTKSGCTCGAAGSYSEGRQFVRSFLERAIQGDKRRFSQVRMLFTDSPEKVDAKSIHQLFPQLRCVAADPLHRILEVEGFFGKARTELSAALRLVHAKFSPRADFHLGAESGGFFSKMRASAGKTAADTADELSLKRDFAPRREADILIQRLADPGYLDAPFRSRHEYMELICALIVKFNNQMGRTNDKGRTLLGVLRSALNPATVEYLLNGSRYLCGNLAARGNRLPVGTAGNEALHAELKLWFSNMNNYHRDRMDLSLSLFLMVKLVGYYAAVAFPCTLQLRQGEVIRRLLNKFRRDRLSAPVCGGSSTDVQEKLPDLRKPLRPAQSKKRRQRDLPESSAPDGGKDAKRRRSAPSVPRKSRVFFSK